MEQLRKCLWDRTDSACGLDSFSLPCAVIGPVWGRPPMSTSEDRAQQAKSVTDENNQLRRNETKQSPDLPVLAPAGDLQPVCGVPRTIILYTYSPPKSTRQHPSPSLSLRPPPKKRWNVILALAAQHRSRGNSHINAVCLLASCMYSTWCFNLLFLVMRHPGSNTRQLLGAHKVILQEQRHPPKTSRFKSCFDGERKLRRRKGRRKSGFSLPKEAALVGW